MGAEFVTISIPAGMYVEIEAPVIRELGVGPFPKDQSETVLVNGQVREHINGFVSEYEDIGIIEDIPGESLKVKYTQLKNGENRVYFFSDNGDKAVVDIISIPIHDHSSIYQGGPAFGTYKSDYEVEDNG